MLLVFLLSLPAFANAAGAPSVAATPVPGDPYSARATDFPHGVTGPADVTYSTIEGFRPLTLDLYLPMRRKSDPPRPLVVFVGAPPFLLVHGTQDRTVAAAQSESFARVLRAAGVKVDLLLIPGADHSFIGATPQDTRRDSLLALQRSFDFIAATLHSDSR